jgi:hypothetical protein
MKHGIFTRRYKHLIDCPADDPAQPYEIRWMVLNRGERVKQQDRIRGQIKPLGTMELRPQAKTRPPIRG